MLVVEVQAAVIAAHVPGQVSDQQSATGVAMITASECFLPPIEALQVKDQGLIAGGQPIGLQ
jgi:hypothetical protein